MSCFFHVFLPLICGKFSCGRKQLLHWSCYLNLVHINGAGTYRTVFRFESDSIPIKTSHFSFIIPLLRSCELLWLHYVDNARNLFWKIIKFAEFPWGIEKVFKKKERKTRVMGKLYHKVSGIFDQHVNFWLKLLMKEPGMVSIKRTSHVARPPKKITERFRFRADWDGKTDLLTFMLSKSGWCRQISPFYVLLVFPSRCGPESKSLLWGNACNNSLPSPHML